MHIYEDYEWVYKNKNRRYLWKDIRRCVLSCLFFFSFFPLSRYRHSRYKTNPISYKYNAMLVTLVERPKVLVHCLLFLCRRVVALVTNRPCAVQICAQMCSTQAKIHSWNQRFGQASTTLRQYEYNYDVPGTSEPVWGQELYACNPFRT